MDKIIYFDTETIPCQAPGVMDEFRASVQAPAQYKKPESIAEWLKENREAEAEAAWLKTSFDGGMGQIVVIGYAVNDGPAQSLSVADLSAASEAALLNDFFDVVSSVGGGVKFCGHNIIGFDLPFVWKRAMVLGVKPPFTFPRAPKPWSELVHDTMLLWDPTQRAGGSMERICRAFGLEGKGGMDGSKVWPAVKEGRIADVARYCEGDIERTRSMFKRMTFADAPKACEAETLGAKLARALRPEVHGV